ncbi:MAG: DNA replication and repair protein RecF, partial [Myxococcota bacterium]|nr:DNA replication and repair protein RecF [Myxococcota bacterium]
GAAGVQGVVVGRSGRRQMEWRRDEAGRRSLALDDRPCHELSAWFGLLRAVLFCPEHVAVVRGEPAERRRFIDRAAFTAAPAHLETVQAYRRALKQKAAALKLPRIDPALVATFDAQLIEHGARLARRRVEVLAELAAPVSEMHTAIAGGGDIRLSMRGVGGAAHDSEEAAKASIAEALEKVREDERRRRRVLAGPHRDDVDIRLDGRSARAFASQGQARSLVLSLKLAELEAARRRGDAPLFLLDDLTSELDRGRMGRLVELLAGLPNQVWITTTDPAHLGPLPAGGTRVVRVRAGCVEGDGTVAERAPSS